MSNEALTAVAKADIRPSGRKFVAMALADYADEAWSCFPSVEQLARYTSQGEKTVRDHLDALEELGVITRDRQRREDGTLGRYRFKLHRRNLPVAEIANGEKQPEPPAKSATHNPQLEPSSIFSLTVREFDQFWAVYPNKVGKRAAEKAFAAARKRVSQADLMAGLVAYTRKSDDRPWCNPATWLNQDRWEDRPAQQPVRAGPAAQQPKPKGSDFFDIEAQERMNGPAGNHRGDQGDWDDVAGVPILAIDYHR